MTTNPPPGRFTAQRLPAAAIALLLWLGACPPAAAQAAPPVTSEGFEQAAEGATFYMPMVLDEVIGVDSPGPAVEQALKTAVKNPDVRHVVFMVNSEYGVPLQSEHIGDFQRDLKIAAIVRNALAPAIFPVFYADEVFVTEGALIGGLPLDAYVPPGSKEVTSKQIGIYSSMLASGAQTRGHDPAIAQAMTDKNKKLYAWREDGGPVLSNTKPGKTEALEDYRQVRSFLPGSTLVMESQTAIDIGFAKPIAAFDHALLGEAMGLDNWRLANQYARVAFEIGAVVGELQPLREAIEAYDRAIPDIQASRNSSTEVRGYRQFKKNLDNAVTQIQMIEGALAKLYKVHPERHTYILGEDGRTLLADPEAWAKDLKAAKAQLRLASGQVRRLTDDFRKLGGDPEYLYGVNKLMETINGRLRGIETLGNARYWQDIAGPDVPDDVYG